jgi:predicted DCC family thiol-disulfide oxidoreductase YuxK
MSGTFLFDGDCAFCTSCARFIERWIRTPARVQPWQRADLDSLRVTPAQCEESVQWSEPGIEPVPGPLAIAALLRSAVGWAGRVVWRPLGVLLGSRPVLALAWPVYRWVARNRSRLPGGTAACAVPPPAGASHQPLG